VDFIGLAMVKNEEDIIEQFVRHNLRFFKRLYIFDHSSVDSTPRILASLVGEGLPVTILKDSRDFIGHAQAEVMTVLLRMAVRDNGAAVYFSMDADEFVHLRPGLDRAGLEARLNALGTDVSFLVPWLCMIVPDGAEDAIFTDVPKSIRLMETWEHSQGRGSKVVIKIDTPSLGQDLVLCQGNHYVKGAGITGTVFDDLRYIHVPVRSAEQVYRKIVGNWLSNVARFGKNTDMSAHWGVAFRRICETGSLKSTDLGFMLPLYACTMADGKLVADQVKDADIFQYELKYGHMRQNTHSILFRDMEELLDRIYTLKREQG
jgi:hypothetical protein